MDPTTPRPVRVRLVGGTDEFPDDVAAALEDADGRLSVERAESADDALARVYDADCLVTGREFPGLTGIEFVEAVRDDFPDLPVFLYTERERSAVAGEALAAGATDYVRRGDDPEGYAVLANRITNAVDRGGPASGRDGPGGANADVDEGSGHSGSDDGEANVDEGSSPSGQDGSVRDADRGSGADESGADESAERAGLEIENESNLLDQIFDQVPAHIFVKDTEGRHLKVSTHLTEDQSESDDDNDDLLVGSFTRENILGKRDIDITDADHARQAYENDMRVVETGEPILRQEEYADDIDEWDLTSKVPWRGPDGEIRGLIGITQRITERKRAQQELERQNERLEEFASVVSHDLRNPLNVAQGWVAEAREESSDPHLDRVADALDRMEELIDDLLALARTGHPVEEADDVDLAVMCEECWVTVETAEASLLVEADRTIRADRARLRQLLENLFRNAVEHGSTSNQSESDDAAEGAEESVTVTVGTLEDGFYVADDGLGIPEAEREDVFERGYTTARSGTGFGLSIVSEVADAHGWEVRVTDSETGGARFEFTGVEFGERQERGD